MTVRDLIPLMSPSTPVEIGSIYTDGPKTMRPSTFSEEVLDHLCVIDRKICLIRLVKDTNVVGNYVIRLVIE